jgi:hypothetical protein
MGNRWMISAAAWVVFTAYTATVALRGDVLALVKLTFSNAFSVQVFFDLVVAATVAMVYVSPKAKALGVPRIPYIIATALVGSVGLLAYITHVEWAQSKTRPA